MHKIDKVLAFDLWGDYAHFRKLETTTSPLTYSIPTGTALAGVISAILGFDRDSYYELFYPENIKLAIRLINPIKKVRININLIKTDDGFYLWDNIMKGSKPRSPTSYEFVKDPKYRVYVWLKNKELHNKLKNFLQNHKSFYTTYLGINGTIANFNYIEEYDVSEPESRNEDYVHSLIRKDKSKLIIENNRVYIKERIPIFMDKDRIVQDYADVFFEAKGKLLKVKDTSFYKIGDENVVFL